MKFENGFHFLEFPAASGKPDALVVILPGHHNHPRMFEKLADYVHQQRPEADVLIVRGPVPLNVTEEVKISHGVPDVDDLYTWHKVEKGASKAYELAKNFFLSREPVVDELNKFVDAQLSRRKLEDENLVIFGFSLGGAVASQMGTRRSRKCAAVVCHSAPTFPVHLPQSRPDTLMLIGDQDKMFYADKPSLPPKGMLKKAFQFAADNLSLQHPDSVRRLKRAGVPVESEVVPGLGHTISEASFGRALKFMLPRLKK